MYVLAAGMHAAVPYRSGTLLCRGRPPRLSAYHRTTGIKLRDVLFAPGPPVLLGPTSAVPLRRVRTA